MSRIIFFPTCLLVLLFDISYAQEVVGIVTDKITNHPIADVHVYFSSGIGTITNEEGYFVIDVKDSKNDTLHISHISYENDLYIIGHRRNVEIKLKPSITTLKEVTVYSKDYTFKLVSDIYNKLKDKNLLKFGRGFYRQLTLNNNEPTEIQEIFLDLAYTPNGINKYISREARFAKKKSSIDKPLISFTNQFPLTLGFKLVPDQNKGFIRPFNEGFTNDVEFEIMKEFSSNNIKYVEISFQPSENTVKSFKGSLIINRSNNCICQYNGETHHSLGLDSLRTKVKSIAVKNHTYKVSLVFDCNNSNASQLIYSIGSSYFETDFGTTSVTSKFFVYEPKIKKVKDMKEFDVTTKDVEIINQTKYHPEFWKNNEIVKRTRLEDGISDTFEKSNSFGTYVIK